MGNYMIAVGNYVIVSPSELGNYKIADTGNDAVAAGYGIRLRENTCVSYRKAVTRSSRWAGFSLRGLLDVGRTG
jgi:hypothetical protein